MFLASGNDPYSTFAKASSFASADFFETVTSTAFVSAETYASALYLKFGNELIGANSYK